MKSLRKLLPYLTVHDTRTENRVVFTLTAQMSLPTNPIEQKKFIDAAVREVMVKVLREAAEKAEPGSGTQKVLGNSLLKYSLADK